MQETQHFNIRRGKIHFPSISLFWIHFILNLCQNISFTRYILYQILLYTLIYQGYYWIQKLYKKKPRKKKKNMFSFHRPIRRRVRNDIVQCTCIFNVNKKEPLKAFQLKFVGLIFFSPTGQHSPVIDWCCCWVEQFACLYRVF